VFARVAASAIEGNTISSVSVASGNRSASGELVVRGYNLTTNITAVAPEGWEVAGDNASYSRIAMIPVMGSVANVTIHVRMDGSGPLAVREGQLSLSHGVEFILSTKVSLQGNLEESRSQPPPTGTNKPSEKEDPPEKKKPSKREKTRPSGKKRKEKKKTPAFENNSDKRNGVGPVPVAQCGSTWIMSDGSIRWVECVGMGCFSS
jgi:hypothetical protein